MPALAVVREIKPEINHKHKQTNKQTHINTNTNKHKGDTSWIGTIKTNRSGKFKSGFFGINRKMYSI